MVPIHDSDIAQERWAKAEWENYELWEKIELRARRKKLMWIGATAALFLALSSVPIILDRGPKWKGLRVVRELAQEITSLKKMAGVERGAFRIRFEESEMKYVVERVKDCGEPGSSEKLIRSGELPGFGNREQLSLLSPEEASRLGMPGVDRTFCYDFLKGSSSALAAFAVIPVKDLTEMRSDRVSLLLVSGPAGELSFE